MSTVVRAVPKTVMSKPISADHGAGGVGPAAWYGRDPLDRRAKAWGGGDDLAGGGIDGGGPVIAAARPAMSLIEQAGDGVDTRRLRSSIWSNSMRAKRA